MTDQLTPQWAQEATDGRESASRAESAARDEKGRFKAPEGRTADVRFRETILVDDATGCWVWRGWRSEKGYGNFHVDGRMWSAHRWAYTRYVGPVPDGLLVLHSCDNPPCVNPDHLRPGTHAENMRDRTERGRGAQQQRTHCPKGHPYDEANTVWKTSPTRAPYRQCRACRQIACNERNARVRAKARRARQDGAPPAELSPALLETLRLTAAGMVRGQIAAALGISVDAVDTRRSEIYLKLRVHSKQQAIERARQLDLLPAATSTGGPDA